MSSFREHLASPQFPDEDPESAAAEADKKGLNLYKISGGWIAPGQPRWRAYLFYGISIIGGAILALTSTGGMDLIAFAGIAFVAFGVYGLAEAIRGKRFTRP